jgi:hypothetical protein
LNRTSPYRVENVTNILGVSVNQRIRVTDSLRNVRVTAGNHRQAKSIRHSPRIFRVQAEEQGVSVDYLYCVWSGSQLDGIDAWRDGIERMRNYCDASDVLDRGDGFVCGSRSFNWAGYADADYVSLPSGYLDSW